MAIGERIRFIRNLRGMTQKYLGIQAGLPENTADIRMTQYETGARNPKQELTNAIASVLDVSPLTLDVPDIDSYHGLIHTLFALEDRYGLTVENRDGDVALRFDPRKGKDAASISQMVLAWAAKSDKYHRGEISKEEYDRWRYNYPKYDTTQNWARVPSKELSDALAEAFKDKLEID